jgi:GT2 family glycosyltransferase/glycosyltransferase involved in cell wall biosynthesis
MRVLQIVHGLPPASAGGTETYVINLSRALARRPGLDVTVLAREADPQRPELSTRHERRGAVDIVFLNNTFAGCASFADSYRHPALAAAVAPLLDRLDPGVVHIQHLTCLSTELVSMVKSRRIPIVMTLNDYWPICHRGQLIDLHGTRCDGPGDQGCATCIPAGVVAPAGVWRAARRLRELPVPIVRSAPAVLERLAAAARPASTRELSRARSGHMRAMLGDIDLLLAPSQTLREQYIRFGIPAERLEWCNQGIDTSGVAVTPDRASRPGPLRIAFAGSLILSKGPHLLLDAIDRLPPGAVVVDFLGSVAPYHGDARYAASLQQRLGHAAIRRTGPIPHERMPAALADADVLVVPSTWIENAPFIIREAFASGLPVIASRLGGMAEMVRDEVDGLLFDAGDARSLTAAFRRFLDEPSLLGRLRAGIRPVFTIDEDAEQLHPRYAELASARTPRRSLRPPAPSSDRSIAVVILDYRTPHETFLAARSVDTSIGANAEIVIVENAGDPEVASQLRSRLPRARVIESGSNLGFPAGCNVGIRDALGRDADAVLLLNSDTVLHPAALRELADVLWSGDRIGIVSAVSVSREEPQIIASAGMRYDARTGRMRHLAAGRRFASLGSDPVRRVDGASGCALLIKRAVFERIGLLDEAYFFSFEDLEFCLRARKAGFETVCASNAIVYHEGGRSIGARSPRRVYYGVRNHLRLAQQVAPFGPAARLARSAIIVGLSASYVALSPEVPIGPGLLAMIRGTLDHARGRYGA